jgi:hypothetical protein
MKSTPFLELCPTQLSHVSAPSNVHSADINHPPAFEPGGAGYFLQSNDNVPARWHVYSADEAPINQQRYDDWSRGSLPGEKPGTDN